jgi:hypothetical protein
MASPQIAALAELAQLDQWVVSRPVIKLDKQGNIVYDEAGNPKIDKPPFSPHTGYQCSHSKPAAWSSYQDAQAARARFGFPWLGFAFHQADPYTGIDLDGCAQAGVERIATLDDLEPWARRIVDQVHSYTEVSPSGLGVKIFVRGNSSWKHSMEGAHKGIEVYCAQRFFTVTGAHLAGTRTEICEAQSVLDQLQAEYKPVPSAGQRQPTQTHRTAPAAAGRPGRYVAAETIAAANEANDLGAYLESQGAHLVHVKDEQRYYSGLAGDVHTHQITYVVSPAAHGRGHIGKSYSPNGRLNITDFPQGFRFFDAYCAIEHGGNVVAALKALTPGRPARNAGQRQPAYQVEPPAALSPIERQRRAAENERKQLQRQQAAAATFQALRARAAADSMMDARAQRMLEIHLQLAGQDLKHTQSVIGQANLAHYSERNAQLVEHGYITRTLRGRKKTALWTLQQSSTQCVTMPQNTNSGVILESGEGSPMYILESDSYSDSRVSEGGRAVQPDSPLPAAPAETAIAYRELLSQVRHLAREVAEPLWMLRDYDEWSAAQLQAEAERLQTALDQAAAAAAPVEPPAVRVVEPAALETHPEPAEYLATYTEPAIEPSGEYTGGSKYHIPDLTRLAWADETFRLIDLPAASDEPAPQAPPARRRAGRPRGAVSAGDRYRADVALMDECRLAGEIKKHTATLKKHAGAAWLDQVRRKLAIVQAEIDDRAGGAARSAGQLQAGTAPIGRSRAGNRPPSQAQAALGLAMPHIHQAALFG